MVLPIIRLLVATTVVCAQDIIYEQNDDDTCILPNGGNGICKDHRLCPSAYDNFPRERPVRCGFVGNNPVICCPVKIDRVTEEPDVLIPLIDISPPVVDFECGDSAPSEVFLFDFASDFAPSAPVSVNGPAPVFKRQLSKKQFRPPNAGLPSVSIPSDGLQILAGVGGGTARRVLAKYTALIGASGGSQAEPDWFCTGVLINHQWVLTAAHCEVQRRNGVVRLGEHDYSNPDDGSNPIDFRVLEVIQYPEYSSPQGYHDIALLKLSSPVVFESTINPVCLPWGDASNIHLTNQRITLTGWGATRFGGLGSPVLQEVNVTIFDTSVCQSSYQTLRNYDFVWPRGIGEGVLCAGDPEGGKDACQGDSGGPVTYLTESGADGRRGHYVLAGLVSNGYGCGLQEFPGLYADMHYPPYLAWIKRIAFPPQR